MKLSIRFSSLLCAVAAFQQTVSATPTQARNRAQPPSDVAVFGNATAFVPSPNQACLVRMYSSGKIDRHTFIQRWDAWEEHHIGKLTRFGRQGNHLERRAALDSAAAIISSTNNLMGIASYTNTLARYIVAQWQSRYGNGQGGDDVEVALATDPATSARVTLPANPSGSFNGNDVVAAMTDQTNCLARNGATRVCITANIDGSFTMTAEFAVRSPDAASTPAVPSDEECESADYETCDEGPAPPNHDEFRIVVPRSSVCQVHNAQTIEPAGAGGMCCPANGGDCSPACMSGYSMHCDALGVFGADPAWMQDDICKNCVCGDTC